MKFKWNLQPEFQRYKAEQHVYINEEGSGEYIGNVRVGNLCFDIIDWEITYGLTCTLVVLIQDMDMGLINIRMIIVMSQVFHGMTT